VELKHFSSCNLIANRIKEFLIAPYPLTVAGLHFSTHHFTRYRVNFIDFCFFTWEFNNLYLWRSSCVGSVSAGSWGNWVGPLPILARVQLCVYIKLLEPRTTRSFASWPSTRPRNPFIIIIIELFVLLHYSPRGGWGGSNVKHARRMDAILSATCCPIIFNFNLFMHGAFASFSFVCRRSNSNYRVYLGRRLMNAIKREKVCLIFPLFFTFFVFASAALVCFVDYRISEQNQAICWLS